MPFMHGVRAGLLAKGVSENDIHYEIFGPDSWSPAAA
jgi:nitric oxide dioxygenase